MKELLKHLNFTPLCLMVAFSVAGAPSAPVGNMMPDIGVAYAIHDCSSMPMSGMSDRLGEPNGQRQCRPYDYGITGLLKALGKGIEKLAQLTVIIVGWLGLAVGGYLDWVGETWDRIKDNAAQLRDSVREYCAENPASCIPGQPISM